MKTFDDDMPLHSLAYDDPELRGRLGRHLRGIRELQKITQTAMANAIGLSHSQLSINETGKAPPTWDAIRAICLHLNISVKELIEKDRGQSSPNPPATSVTIAATRPNEPSEQSIPCPHFDTPKCDGIVVFPGKFLCARRHCPLKKRQPPLTKWLAKWLAELAAENAICGEACATRLRGWGRDDDL